jgi:dynactin complex subunit
MVLFHNVNVGQKVEVNIGWGNIKGTVQYKGSLAGKQGEWVGVYLDERGKDYCIKTQHHVLSI